MISNVLQQPPIIDSNIVTNDTNAFNLAGNKASGYLYKAYKRETFIYTKENVNAVQSQSST
jgi:hypothetical protein